jgi:hypothetical protein
MAKGHTRRQAHEEDQDGNGTLIGAEKADKNFTAKTPRTQRKSRT